MAKSKLKTPPQKKWKWAKPAAGHRMREEEHPRPMAPSGGEPRFYGVRKCLRCSAEQYEHPAGKFMDDELQTPCLGKSGNSEKES